MNTQRYFESRVESGLGFHYQSELQNAYAHNIRRNALFSKLNFRDKRVVDIGCGDGSWILEYLRKGAEFVLGVEQGQKLMQNAADNLKQYYSYDRGSDYSLSACPGGHSYWRKYRGKRFDIVTLITVYNFMSDRDRNKMLLDVQANILKIGGKIAILDYLPNEVPDYQKKLEYKDVQTEWDVVNKLKVLGYRNIEVTPISFVDSFLFHHFGVNAVTKKVTEFLDYNFMWLFSGHAKYKLVIAEK